MIFCKLFFNNFVITILILNLIVQSIEWRRTGMKRWTNLIIIFAVIIFIIPVLLFLIIVANEKRKLLPGFKLVFLVETGFVLVGILSFLVFL